MQSPPTEYLTKYGWIGYIVFAVFTWLSKERVSEIVGGWFGRKKSSAEADGLSISNVGSANEIVQEIFRNMARAEMKAIKAIQREQELLDIIEQKERTIVDMKNSLESKEKYIHQLLARLKGNGKV